MINARAMEIETTTRIRNVDDLKLHIAVLERRMHTQEKQLKKDLREVYLSLQLKNMVKNAFKSVREDPGIKSQVIRSSVGLGARLLLDKVFFRKRKGVRGFLLSEGIKQLLSFYLDKNKRLFLKNGGI
jgi:hypothetical protein